MKLKRIIPIIVAGICMTCQGIVSAEEATETATEDMLSVLTAEETTPPKKEETTTTTTTSTTTMTTTVNDALEYQIETMPTVTTPSYYDEILKYVGTESAEHLNDNLGNDALTIDKSTIDYSEKSLFTITTRSGDVFYLIINSSDGSVYFLNTVDTSDLTALLSEDSAKAGSEINQSALDNMTATEAASVDESNTTSKAENKSDSSSDMKSNLIFTVGIIAAVVIVCGVFAFIKAKRGKQSSYDDDFFAAADEVNETVSDVIPYNVEDDFEMDAEQIENPPEEKPVDETNSTATATYYNDEDDFEENDIY